MVRSALIACALLALGGCVKNDAATAPGAASAAAANVQPAAAPAEAPVTLTTPAATIGTVPMTSTERLVKSKEIVTHKTTISGGTLLLATASSLAPDCTPLGDIEVKVLIPPQHGAVHAAAGTAFPEYVPGDASYACNKTRSPAEIITYRSTPSFTGEDSTLLQIFFPNGDAPKFLFHLSVE
jgi:hypothetical protein